MPDEVTQVVKNLGLVTAYGYAKAGGYTGTEEQFKTAAAAIASGAATATAAALDAAADAAAAEAWATGSSGGTPGATNNAEYYAGLAASSAEEAAGYLPLDEDLDKTNKAAQGKAVGDAIASLQSQIDDLNYTAVSISQFTLSPAQAEVDSTVNNITMTYKLNKVPATLKYKVGSGSAVSITPVKTGSTALTSQGITSNTTFTLSATDSGSPSHEAASASKTATLHFLYRAYWGTATIPGSIDSAFITGLGSSELASDVTREIDVDSTGGKYVWYAVPASIDGNGCKFKIEPSDFYGGFNEPTNVSVTSYESEPTYHVYRSTYPDLGDTTVHVESN